MSYDIIFDHIGIVIRDIGETVKFYRDIIEIKIWSLGILNLGRIKMIQLKIGDMLNCFSRYPERNPGSQPFYGIKGEGISHMSIFTDAYDEDVKRMRGNGYTVDEKIVSKLFSGYNIRTA